VLDEIFGNPTDLPLGEHTVDTAGQTLAMFGIFDLAGLQFSPRIRDIGRLQLSVASAQARRGDPGIRMRARCSVSRSRCS
jgi:TnpA family transposase